MKVNEEQSEEQSEEQERERNEFVRERESLQSNE